MTLSHSFKLSKNAYREEAIKKGITAFSQYLTDSKITNDSSNFLLTLQIKPDVKKTNIVTGKLLNFILEESVELVFQENNA